MCGIFGQLSFGEARPNVAELLPLLDSLRHRGPDAGGYFADGPYFLGHRRLSIIDLTETGAQPMSSADGRIVVTYNGEIYNYVELREELRAKGHVFRTTSDTEVLLHGWDAWGDALPSKLTGMFAFAIADRKTGELFLARDRFGEKPLYVMEDASGVTFASELAPLCALRGARRAIDESALASYLCLNYVPGTQTMMAGIARVPPGGYRKYGARGLLRAESYWEPGSVAGEPAAHAPFGDVLRDARARVDDAVRIALRSDVPLALFLSGGIDSSVVAESAVRQGVISAAFCVDIRASSFSEWDNARHVADKLGLRLERVPLDHTALENFQEIIAHADDPLADSSAVAVWQLAKATAQEFKVAVSGDGGDELFGGYLTYKATAVHRAFTHRLGTFARVLTKTLDGRARATESKVSASYKLLRFARAMDLPPGEAHFTWNGAFLPAQAARLVSKDRTKELARGAIHALAERHGLLALKRGSRDPADLSALQRADAHEYLTNDILVKVDRMCMAHSLESRAPLLDHRLASLAFASTPRFESLARPPKRILRQLADDVYGARISRAKKQGFSIPIHAWLRGPARFLVSDLLSRDSVRALGVLDEDEVLRVTSRLLDRGEPLGFEVYGLCALVAWHRARVVSSPHPSTAPRGRPAIEIKLPSLP